jgi:hypothetical protein
MREATLPCGARAKLVRRKNVERGQNIRGVPMSMAPKTTETLLIGLVDIGKVAG